MQQDTLFTNARIIDGNGGTPIERGWLAISGGRIAGLGSDPAPNVAPGARVIDATGKTIMPGLFDCHVHPGNLHEDVREVPKLRPAVYVHEVTRILENDVRLGFTTLRDAAGLDAGFRDAVNLGLIKGPRLYLCISPLSQTGGHGDKRPAYVDHHIPRNSLGVYPAICDSPDAMRKASREALRKGANHIKVMADGGVTSPSGGPGASQLSVPEIKAAVEVAENAGTYVMAHVYTPRAVSVCLDAGVRSIDHATLIDREICDRMAATGAYLVPTLVVFEILSERRDEFNLPRNYFEKLDIVREGGMRALEWAHKAGVRIASGSDLIGPLRYQAYKGRELALQAKVMGAMGAIVAATKTSAELMMVDNDLGTLEPGKLADVIMLDGNPLEDLAIFEPDSGRVLLTMIGGNILWEKKATGA